MNYDRIIATAKTQISDKGRTVTLRRADKGTYDPITNSFEGASIADSTVSGVFTDYKESEIDGTLIKRGDKELLIAALDISPDTDDLIIDGSDQYKIVNIRTVSPGGAVLMYKLQVRR